MICCVCDEPIETKRPYVAHPNTERNWHVMCAPPVPFHEKGARQYVSPWRLRPEDRVALDMLKL